MTADEKSSGPQSPIAMWEQWYETASREWTQNTEGGKEAFADPYGLYQAWLKSAREAQRQLLTSTTKALEPQEAWKRWFDATTEPWRKLIADGADPSGLVTRWLEMMEEARTRLLQGNSIAADPFTFFKQWYDATSETWAKVIGETIGSDRFMREISQFLENYTSFTRAAHRASEEYVGYLQLSTRADAARVAELVINVENKVEKLEDAFEDFAESNTQAAATTSETLAGLAARLDGLEHSLETLPGTLQKVEEKVKMLDTTFEKFEGGNARAIATTHNALASVASRLDGVEKRFDELPGALQKTEEKAEKLDMALASFEKSQTKTLASLAARLDGLEHSLETLPGALQKVANAVQLEQRLDSVEGKLNKLLSALEHIEQTAAKSAPAPRKTRSSKDSPARSKAVKA
jgi:polyhydroxyalkanoic acid synthase PhaR subunit